MEGRGTRDPAEEEGRLDAELVRLPGAREGRPALPDELDCVTGSTAAASFTAAGCTAAK